MCRNHKYIYIFSCLLFLTNYQIKAQDITSLKDRKPFEISGYLNASMGFYESNRTNSFRSPFNWYMSGSLNPSIYEINIPLTLTLSKRQADFNANIPTFTRIGVSPQWKWITVHAGWRNMDFSKYTMNGYTFKGVGLELTPGIFRISAMYGNLENEWYQPILEANGDPTGLDLFNRKGMAFKFGIGKDQNHIDFILFNAKDQIETALTTQLDQLNITPGENLALGGRFKVTLFKSLSLEGDVGASAITSNSTINTPIYDEDLEKYANQIDPFLTVNRSSRYYLAGETGIHYRSRKFSIGLRYIRVDPFFNTYGLYFLQRDFENYLINLNFSLAKGKINVSGNYGFQQNNLRNFLSNTSQRQVGSVSLNIKGSEHFSLTANYSNLTTDQKAGLIEVNDTLRIANMGTSGSVAPRFTFGDKERKHVLTIRGAFNQFEDLNVLRNDFTNKTLNGQIGYTYTIKESKLRFNVGLNFRQNEFRENLQQRYGIRLGASKPIWEEKLTIRLNTNYFQSRLNDLDDGFIVNGTLGLQFKLPGNHSLNMSHRVLFRRAKVQEAYNEWRGNISYGYSF